MIKYMLFITNDYNTDNTININILYAKLHEFIYMQSEMSKNAFLVVAYILFQCTKCTA